MQAQSVSRSPAPYARQLSCSAACAYDTGGCTTCGNSVVQPGETCDDGNTTPGDGCSALCQTEMCDPDGTYTMTFSGPDCGCFGSGCANQMFSITAMR